MKVTRENVAIKRWACCTHWQTVWSLEVYDGLFTRHIGLTVTALIKAKDNCQLIIGMFTFFNGTGYIRHLVLYNILLWIILACLSQSDT